jgi:predicted NUDIX family NTP pyrophosphohydrolase
MSNALNVSAGLLLYRFRGSRLEVFLAHPGGPFWVNRDAGAWTIPKGTLNPGELPLAAACREFEEETGIKPQPPFFPLGSIRQKAGKTVHAWAWEGNADPRLVKSNVMRLEWPRKSGRWLTFPEVDRCAWFTVEAAKERILASQIELITRLEALLQGSKAM